MENILPQLNESYEVKEEYRRLRTNIQFYGKKVKVIVFTSCHPGEGKSEISLQVARSLCQLEKKVLYIDADLRRPVLEEQLTLEERPEGLSQYLADISSLESIILHTETAGLDIVTAGVIPPNPTELLAGKKFKQMVIELKQAYDYVIIDSPPCEDVVDALVIASVCDGAVLVVQDKHTAKQTLIHVKEELDKTGTIMLGAVLNKVDFKKNTKYKKYKKYYEKKYTQETA